MLAPLTSVLLSVSTELVQSSQSLTAWPCMHDRLKQRASWMPLRYKMMPHYQRGLGSQILAEDGCLDQRLLSITKHTFVLCRGPCASS